MCNGAVRLRDALVSRGCEAGFCARYDLLYTGAGCVPIALGLVALALAFRVSLVVFHVRGIRHNLVRPR